MLKALNKCSILLLNKSEKCVTLSYLLRSSIKPTKNAKAPPLPPPRPPTNAIVLLLAMIGCSHRNFKGPRITPAHLVTQ